MSLRGTVDRLLASRTEIEADEERLESLREGTLAIVDLQDRQRARVSGVLRSVILRPRSGIPALEAELYDGSGTLRLVWLGRREIAGIEPGRRARLEGLVCTLDGRASMFNPRYELRTRPGE